MRNWSEKTQFLVEKVNAYAQEKDYPFHLFSIASIFWIAFTREGKVQRADQIEAKKMEYFKQMHAFLLENGIYIGPSGYEVGFCFESSFIGGFGGNGRGDVSSIGSNFLILF